MNKHKAYILGYIELSPIVSASSVLSILGFAYFLENISSDLLFILFPIILSSLFLYLYYLKNMAVFLKLSNVALILGIIFNMQLILALNNLELGLLISLSIFVFYFPLCFSFKKEKITGNSIFVTKLNWVRKRGKRREYYSVFENKKVFLSMNDFPEFPMYTLFMPKEDIDLDDLPECWSMES